MASVGSAATVGEKELKTKYPVTEGITAGTTKLRKKPNLEAKGNLGQKRLTKVKSRVGL